MGWRLNHIRSTLRALIRVRRLQKTCTVPEMIHAIESNPADFAPPDDREMTALQRHWWFWKHLHPALHRNPCLYFSMLALAHELLCGRDVEVNVWMSTGQGRGRGHCWLTRDGAFLYERDRGVVPSRAERLSQQGRIIYWWCPAG